jgi:hypothetical protein
MVHHALCEAHDDYGNHSHDDHHDGTPDCAKACHGLVPENCHPTCADFKDMIAPGGCASTCDEATIALGRHHFCENHDHHGRDDGKKALIFKRAVEMRRSSGQNVWAKHRPTKLMATWAAKVRKSAKRSVWLKRTAAKLMAVPTALHK